MTPDLKELTRRLRETPPNVLKEREAAAAIDSLIAELEQAKKDAERYRHIKASHHKESVFDMYEGHRLWFAVYDTKRKGLDSAIDAAIAKEQS